MKFISDISGKEFSNKERVPAKLVRQPILDIIKQDNPDFDDSCSLAASELNQYRSKYISDFLEQELGQLCDWAPNRYITLLPPALRSRWKLQTGGQTDPQGSSNDERIMFYYAYYRLHDPDYPKGANICAS